MGAELFEIMIKDMNSYRVLSYPMGYNRPFLVPYIERLAPTNAVL